MTQINSADSAPQQSQNSVQPQSVAKVDGGGNLNKSVLSDVATALAGHPVDAIAAIAVPVGARVANTFITQRGETRREQLRQEGETERARIAQHAPDAWREPPSA